MAVSDIVTSVRPDISVLIVNYNVKDYLLQCLRSLEAQSPRRSLQIIVVDNASTDGSVDELRPLFPDVTWIPLPDNVGFGRGNNVGLAQCTGRYTLFLNPDTIVAPDTLDVMVRYLDGNPDVGLAGCKVLNADGTFQVACRRGFPTPWASFCKLFGLQALFPSSPLFARYNQTFRPVDATYDVDALIGAFMIGPTDVITNVDGFDPAFFMYGEDLDLCYRIKQSGHRVVYVHSTSIVHFKGESTRRSSMNEVRVFYEAMTIFAKKHYGRSRVLIGLLRLGISFRAVIERIRRRSRESITVLLDTMAVTLSLMAATTIRFGEPLGFPAYAYPNVFFVVAAVMLLSLVAVGEYVEYRPTVRRSVVGLLATFFVLSSLTYFFKEYAFSRGVVLMTIGFTAVVMIIIRGCWALYDGWRGQGKPRRILIIGTGETSERLIAVLRTAERRRADVVGVVAHGPLTSTEVGGVPVLGSTDWLTKIVSDVAASEVIVADPAVGHDDAMRFMMSCAGEKTRFHIASEYDDIVTARIINDVAGIEPTIQLSPLLRFRNRVVKRSMDFFVALFVLMVFAPVVLLWRTAWQRHVRRWFDILLGNISIVGLVPDGVVRAAGKPGLTGLAHVGRPQPLSNSAVVALNDYYVDNYSVSLDIEIILKHFLQRQRGQ
ncbi:MAG: glycosyltransferase [Candidatus Kapabacteria bacterium]|nr:glycosyltransferase [Candidatus Kapabacteria bacterium]